MAGFVKLYRQLKDWEWYKDQNTKDLFLHCLLCANHKSKKWKGITIKAGSFITSYNQLSIETGISVQQIRTSLNRLKSTQEITQQTTSHYSVISIVKWADYQGQDDDSNNDFNTDINHQSTCSQQAANNQSTTNKNDKKYKNEKNVKNKDLNDLKTMVISNDRDGWFEEFWNIYPKKIQKKTSEQKFKLHVKDELTFNAIMFDLSTRIKSKDWIKEEGQYVPNPTTYLNQRRWEDERPQVIKSSGSRIFDLMGERNE